MYYAFLNVRRCDCNMVKIPLNSRLLNTVLVNLKLKSLLTKHNLSYNCQGRLTDKIRPEVMYNWCYVTKILAPSAWKKPASIYESPLGGWFHCVYTSKPAPVNQPIPLSRSRIRSNTHISRSTNNR